LFCALFPYQQAWECETQNKYFRFDRKAQLFGKTIYFEVERGTQGPEKLREKLDRYVKHFRETREKFYVLFTVQDYQPNPFEKVKISAKEKGFELFRLFDEMELPGNYLVCYHESLIKYPLKTEVVSRFGKNTLETLPPL
jgi:hypothetical protein